MEQPPRSAVIAEFWQYLEAGEFLIKNEKVYKRIGHTRPFPTQAEIDLNRATYKVGESHFALHPVIIQALQALLTGPH